MIFKLEIKHINEGKSNQVLFFKAKNWKVAMKKARKLVLEVDEHPVDGELDIRSFNLELHEGEWRSVL